MWMIFILQMIATVVIFERIYVLFFKRKKISDNILEQVDSDIRQGDFHKAIGRLKPFLSESYEAQLYVGALDQFQKWAGPTEIGFRLQEILIKAQQDLENRISWLPVMANLSTLLGLLGTIVGLIQSFVGVSQMSLAQKNLFLAQGISLAMNTTAYGLILGILILATYAFLNNSFNQQMAKLHQRAYHILSQLGVQNQNVVLLKTK